MKKLTLTILLLLLAGILAACGSSDEDSGDSGSSDTDSSSETSQNTSAAQTTACVEGEAEAVSTDLAADAGAFTIQIEGAVAANSAVDNSTRYGASANGDGAIEINLVDRFVGVGGTGAVIYIPVDVAPGTYPVTPYTEITAQSCYTATIKATSIVVVEEGVITIDSVDGNTISGSFDVIGRDQVQEDKTYEAVGVFNALVLEDVELGGGAGGAEEAAPEADATEESE